MTPSLQEILVQGGNSGGWTVNLNSILLAVITLALSLATYTLIRRNGFSKRLLPTPQDIEDKIEKEELERALLLNERMGQEVEELKCRNKELSSRLKHLEDLERIESVLRKSNISLAKECEKLKAEKEELTLKLNSLSIKPKKKQPIPKRKKKT